MRLPSLLFLTGLIGCGAPAGDDSTEPGATDTDTDPPKVDTGLVLVYREGQADLAPGTWAGTESEVTTSLDGAIEDCRVTNPTTGVPSAQACPGCDFAFDIVFGAGTAEGDACANVRATAGEYDGDTWSYAFARSWADEGTGYTYENVLLVGYEVTDGFAWRMAALAEVASDDSRIDYESIYAYTSYYYYD